MAEQSGGKLTLTSKLGQGTTAKICIPASALETEDEASRSPPERIGYRSGRKLRIVSVDDDPLVSFNTAAMLEDLGHTVFSAANGARALEILRQEDSIDLLITDQAMPGMTGAELAATIRAEKPEPEASKTIFPAQACRGDFNGYVFARIAAYFPLCWACLIIATEGIQRMRCSST